MAQREEIRAADADREAVATRLREAIGEGLLSLDELDQRLRDVYASKTLGDLDRVVADLPAPRSAQRSQLAARPDTAEVRQGPPSRIEANPRLSPWLAVLWRLWFAAVFVNLVIWLVASVAGGQILYFWPIWVAGPWGAANIALTIIFPPRRRD